MEDGAQTAGTTSLILDQAQVVPSQPTPLASPAPCEEEAAVHPARSHILHLSTFTDPAMSQIGTKNVMSCNFYEHARRRFSKER